MEEFVRQLFAAASQMAAEIHPEYIDFLVGQDNTFLLQSEEGVLFLAHPAKQHYRLVYQGPDKRETSVYFFIQANGNVVVNANGSRVQETALDLLRLMAEKHQLVRHALVASHLMQVA